MAAHVEQLLLLDHPNIITDADTTQIDESEDLSPYMGLAHAADASTARTDTSTSASSGSDEGEHQISSPLSFNPARMCSFEASYFAPTLDQSSYLFWSMAHSEPSPTCLSPNYDSEDISSSSSTDYATDFSACASPGIHAFLGNPEEQCHHNQLFQSSLLCDLLPLSATHDTRQQEITTIVIPKLESNTEINREAANSDDDDSSSSSAPGGDATSPSTAKKPAGSVTKRKCTIGRLLYESARLRHGTTSSLRSGERRPRRSKPKASKVAKGPQTYEHKSTKVAKRSTVHYETGEEFSEQSTSTPSASPAEIVAAAMRPDISQVDEFNHIMWSFVSVDPIQTRPADFL